jgi:CRISPR type III-A-associated RAMP protein Csm4
MSTPGFIVRLRPAGPWRFGADSGSRDQVEVVLHSDSLYSALTAAMDQLGLLGEWLAATAETAECVVRIGSLFPYCGRNLYVIPPRHIWPPPASSKIRWKGARFVPVAAVEALLKGETLNEARWAVDPASKCLMPIERNQVQGAPFRMTMRSSGAVDREAYSQVGTHSTACLEFAPGAGLWCAVSFADEGAQQEWSNRVKAAFRLLADTGIGGERSSGWGHAAEPEITEGEFPQLLLGVPAVEGQDETAHWLLSLFSPADDDTIQWERGNYRLLTRSGRIESQAGWGKEKLFSRMVEEGSVLFSDSPLRGSAKNVAPGDFPHPVYRSGFALTIAIPWRTQQ